LFQFPCFYYDFSFNIEASDQYIQSSQPGLFQFFNLLTPNSKKKKKSQNQKQKQKIPPTTKSLFSSSMVSTKETCLQMDIKWS